MKLPLELIEKVIDDLHSDTHALALCSLVSRDWLPRSRFHLFQTVSFHFGNPDSNRSGRFIYLMSAPNCSFKLSVRRLSVWFSVWWAIFRTSADMREIVLILRSMHNIRSIEFFGAEFQYWDHHILSDLLTCLEAVEELKLSASFTNFDQFRQLVGACSSLRALVVFNTTEVSDSVIDPSAPPLTVSSHLRTLRIDGGTNLPRIIDWVIGDSAQSRIRTFSATFDERVDFCAVVALLEKQASSIRSITLGTGYPTSVSNSQTSHSFAGEFYC